MSIKKHPFFNIFVIFNLFMLLSPLISQVRIKEKINLVEPNISAYNNSTNSQLNQIKIRVIICFSSYTYPFPEQNPSSYGEIKTNLKIYHSKSMFNNELLGSASNNSSITLEIFTSKPLPGSVKTILIQGSFITSLGHTAAQFNKGGAGFSMQVYLDDELIPEANLNLSTYPTQYGYSLVLNGDNLADCQTAIKCSNNSNPVPSIDIKEYPNGSFGYDGCQFNNPGFTIPLLGENCQSFEPFDVDICFNESLSSWQANIKGNKVSLRTIKDLCPQELAKYQQNGSIMINSISDMTTKIPANFACEAIKNIFYMQSYPSPLGKIILKEALLAHENEHIKDFKNFLIPKAINMPTGSFSSYGELIKSFRASCSVLKTAGKAKEFAKSFFNQANLFLKNNLEEQYDRYRYQMSKNSNHGENGIQERLIDILKEYQKSIIKKYPEVKKKDSDCLNYIFDDLI